MPIPDNQITAFGLQPWPTSRRRRWVSICQVLAALLAAPAGVLLVVWVLGISTGGAGAAGGCGGG